MDIERRVRCQTSQTSNVQTVKQFKQRLSRPFPVVRETSFFPSSSGGLLVGTCILDVGQKKMDVGHVRLNVYDTCSNNSSMNVSLRSIDR